MKEIANCSIEWLNDDSGYFFRVEKQLKKIKSSFQEIEVIETPMLGRVLRIDECFMTSEKDEFFYHENLVHLAAVTHPNPVSALVIGGGDGGSSEELLKHASIHRLVLAELDSEVVEISREYFREVHRGVFDDPRMEVKIGDGLAYLQTTSDRFDIIILDLTDPLGPSRALYTVEFYTLCKSVLNKGGIVALHVESPVTRPIIYSQIVRTLSSVFRYVRPYLVYIPIYGTLWGMATASDEHDPINIDAAAVERIVLQRGLKELNYYNGAVHQGVLALPTFVQRLLQQEAIIIRAGDPVDLAET